ncbi:hypothetical protein ADUPG1_005667, partial [Aduncisulcus paluster]
DESEKYTIPKFTANDIKTGLKNLTGTASGPDGLTVKAAKLIPNEIWKMIFNKIIECGNTPQSFKSAKLSLIDKDSTSSEPRDVHAIARWRPICCSNVVQRLF